jgi:hypothetical protein
VGQFVIIADTGFWLALLDRRDNLYQQIYSARHSSTSLW